MGKVLPVLGAVALLLAVWLTPQRAAPVRAQSAPSTPCSGSTVSSPMQGHYTGPWHSDGDYHFAVFNTDLDLKIIIDGTLDVTVNPDGTVSGTAHGTVDAPIYHDGIHDVSSGTGTISGIVGGTLAGSGSQLVLSHPVIAMQWGTFIAGGYTVPRSITMPDYQFPAPGLSCVSAGGTIAEQNFPTQFVVADGASGLTQAPGIGSAVGTWTLSSDEASQFTALSQGVDAFIAHASSVLNGSGPLSVTAYDTAVGAPLRDLLGAIHQHPDLARCLLARLDAWIAGALPPLYARAAGASASSDLPTLRSDANLVRFLRLMAAHCTVPDNGATAAVTGAAYAALDRAVAGRDWATAALLAREVALLEGSPGALGSRLVRDLHTLLGSLSDSAARLDAARVAYAIGDDADAGAALRSLTVRLRPAAASPTPHRKKTPKKHPKPSTKTTPKPSATAKPTATPKPTATRTATPTPTATPRPSLLDLLQAGAAAIPAHSSGSPTPTLFWGAVPGATRYVVIVSGGAGPDVPWSWSGTATSVRYGDTSLPGVSGSGDDTWPLALPSDGFTWSVLALDPSGHIVGLALRAHT